MYGPSGNLRTPLCPGTPDLRPWALLWVVFQAPPGCNHVQTREKGLPVTFLFEIAMPKEKAPGHSLVLLLSPSRTVMNPEFGSEKDRDRTQEKLGDWAPLLATLPRVSHMAPPNTSLSSSLKSLQLPSCVKIHPVEPPRAQFLEEGPWASRSAPNPALGCHCAQTCPPSQRPSLRPPEPSPYPADRLKKALSS